MSEPTAEPDLLWEGADDPEQLFRKIRSQLIDVTMVVLAFLAIPSVAASLARVRDIGWHDLMYVHVGFALLIWATAAFRKHLPFGARVSVLLGLSFALGVAGLLAWGLVGMGLVWFVVFSVLAAAFLGLRAGVLAIVASLACVTIIGAGVSSGRISLEFDSNLYAVAVTSWINAVVGIAFFAGISVACLGRIQGSLIDTLRTAAQRAAGLRGSEQRFRTLVEHAADAFVLHDVRGHIMDVNQRTCESLGYTREELLSMVVADIDIEALTDRDERRFWGELAPGSTVTVDGVHRRKDGSTFPVEVRLRQLDWGDQKPVLALARDITERRRGEEAVRRSEEQFRTLVENIPGAVYRYQAEAPWRVKHISESVLSMTGRPASDFVGGSGQALVDLVLPQDAGEMKRSMREAVVSREPFEVECRVRHADGGIRWVYSKGRAVYDENGNAKWMDGVILDITERKQAENRLWESERKSRAWLEFSPVCTKIVDLDFNLQYMSDSGVKDLQIDDITAYYGKPYPFDFYPDSFRDQMIKNLERVKETGEIATQEASVVDIEGNDAWFHSTLVPVNDDEGQIDYIIVVSINTTERKRAEAEHEKLEVQLRQAQKMEAVGTLAAGVAHDFNNSLMVILGNAEMARCVAESGGSVQAQISEIIAAADQASEVSRSLLTFSRETVAHMSPVNMGQFVADSVRLFQRILPAMIEVTVEVPKSQELWIEADAVQLNQVLMNLMVNARDAMPDGGQLRIAVRQQPPDTSGASSAGAMEGTGAVVLSVADKGIGMSEEVLARACDPFFTTKPRGQGTGLGMSVVQGIVETHHGRMHIESEVGQGTSVRIEFPRCEPSEADARRSIERAVSPCVRGTVLVADDNRQVRAVIAASLDAAGCSVIQASDGEEALRTFHVRRDSVDLVILDVDMPKLKGTACLESMRKERPDLPAILISGFHDAASDEAEAAEVVFLYKPFEMVELIRLTEKALWEAEANRDRSDA